MQALARLATAIPSAGVLGNKGGWGRGFALAPAFLVGTFLAGNVNNSSHKDGWCKEGSIKRSKTLEQFKAEVHYLALSEEQERILMQVDQDKREQKATKADDANVPVFVWTRHYMEESDLTWADSDTPILVERAMDAMRKYLVWQWKRQILFSYLEWFYEKGNRSWGELGVDWLAMKRGNYCWALYGLERHQEWHQRRLESHALEIQAGSDAVV